MQALKFLVIGMGVLIFVLLGVVVYAMVAKVGGSGAKAPGFGEVTVPLPPGCRIAEAVPRGESEILLRLEGGEACQQVLLIDAEDGSLLGRISAVPQ